jgi:hypothetical protein
MATNFNSPNLFNPLMLWADMGMRALEMTLSSSQNLGDRVERLTRAGANVDVQEAAKLSSTDSRGRSAFASSSGLALAAQMQRAGLEMMTQAWQQWMSLMGTVTALGVGRPLAETVRNNPLLTAGPQFASRSTDRIGVLPAARGSSFSAQGSPARERRAEEMEHAFAKAGPKRRGRTAARAKPKGRSRGS